MRLEATGLLSSRGYEVRAPPLKILGHGLPTLHDSLRPLVNPVSPRLINIRERSHSRCRAATLWDLMPRALMKRCRSAATCRIWFPVRPLAQLREAYHRQCSEQRISRLREFGRQAGMGSAFGQHPTRTNQESFTTSHTRCKRLLWGVQSLFTPRLPDSFSLLPACPQTLRCSIVSPSLQWMAAAHDQLGGCSPFA